MIHSSEYYALKRDKRRRGQYGLDIKYTVDVIVDGVGEGQCECIAPPPPILILIGMDVAVPPPPSLCNGDPRPHRFGGSLRAHLVPAAQCTATSHHPGVPDRDDAFFISPTMLGGHMGGKRPGWVRRRGWLLLIYKRRRTSHHVFETGPLLLVWFPDDESGVVFLGPCANVKSRQVF